MLRLLSDRTHVVLVFSVGLNWLTEWSPPGTTTTHQCSGAGGVEATARGMPASCLQVLDSDAVGENSNFIGCHKADCRPALWWSPGDVYH